MPFTDADMEICIRLLQEVSEDVSCVSEHDRFKALVAKIHREGKRGKRRVKQQDRVDFDDAIAGSTGIVLHQTADQPPTFSGQTHYQAAKLCYICKLLFHEVHHFYHLLCPSCASRNWEKRSQRCDLSGRIALVTGGRIKIGFLTALKLLRDGSRVIVTTRFRHDAMKRFRQEPDANVWWDQLKICSLDLRDLLSVERFANELANTESHIDIVIHNAAQTVKRPLAFYNHLLEAESHERLALADRTTTTVLIEARPDYRGHLVVADTDFPLAKLDRDGQQVDRRAINSWRLKMGEVGTIEMVEAMIVNAMAPFVLNEHLLPLLQRSPHARKFIVHVSAMEGQFNRPYKSPYHPHTNMAKAATNMLTRTTAEELSKVGIYVSSVDTGWITDEKPLHQAERARDEQGFYLPLDSLDGAARIYDPIARGINEPEVPLHGQFLKDYNVYPW